MSPDARTRRVHYDWLEAGEHTQRTVALLSQQLRRFLDDRAWLENRRIMDLLRGIEAKALALRDTPPAGTFMHQAGTAADIRLPMERPLYRPPVKPLIADIELESGDAELDVAALFSQVVVDRSKLERQVRRALQDRSQVTLQEVCELHPLEQGLAELVAYLQLAGDGFAATVDETAVESVSWRGAGADDAPVLRRARVPRVIFVR